MALTFAAGTSQLVSWGFSAGDIAVLAGAGRAAGTWLIAQMKDRTLIDFMALDIDSVITRKGLVDVVHLHQRWDSKLRLLKNNKPITIHHPAGEQNPVVDNMDRFTWIMTLIVAALDASMSTNEVNRITSRFLQTLLQESPIGVEYLQHEVHQHVQGWRSSACVRGILHKAYSAWAVLERNGKHWPGAIPEGDHREIGALLLWLVAEPSMAFRTGSSDVFCVAAVLQELGMEINVTDSPRKLDEHRISIVLSSDLIAQKLEKPGYLATRHERFGMRVPLAFMYECVSLWPEDLGTNNTLRRIFEDGMNHVEKEGAKLVLTSARSVTFYKLQTNNSPTKGKRLSNVETRVAALFFPKHIYDAAKYLGRLIAQWPEDARVKFEAWLKDEPATQGPWLISTYLPKHAFAELQVFLLGFYYKLLSALLDFSQLSLVEAFGFWSYNDPAFLTQITDFISGRNNLSDTVSGRSTLSDGSGD